MEVTQWVNSECGIDSFGIIQEHNYAYLMNTVPKGWQIILRSKLNYVAVRSY